MAPKRHKASGANEHSREQHQDRAPFDKPVFNNELIAKCIMIKTRQIDRENQKSRNGQAE